IIDGREIKVLKEKDPAALPWGDLGVDLVLESTGLFTDAGKARAHIYAGAKKVIISAPAKGEDITIVLGVNEDRYDPDAHTTVSVVDFTADVRRETTADELNDAFRQAAEGPMKGILGVSDEPLVSTDFRGDSRSSIIDAESTMVLGGSMVKVISWYDNEWGYSCRVADLIGFVGARLPVAGHA